MQSTATAQLKPKRAHASRWVRLPLRSALWRCVVICGAHRLSCARGIMRPNVGVLWARPMTAVARPKVKGVLLTRAFFAGRTP